MKPRIRSAAPILPVADVGATVDWYEQILGATDVWMYGDPVGHAGCMLSSSQIQFSHETNSIEGFELFVFVANVPELCEEYIKRGVKIEEELEIKPWGATEFVVVDPNGVRLRFAEFREKSPKRPAKEDVKYVLRHLNADEHRKLYTAVDWLGYYTEELTPETLSACPLATVVAEHGGKVVGAASICGNGVDAFVVRDVMVIPEVQGSGIGRQLMTDLMKWVEENVPKGAHVILQTRSGMTEFYEEFGFIGPDMGLVAMYFRR